MCDTGPRGANHFTQWRSADSQPWSPLLDLINYSWLNDPNNSLGGGVAEWSFTSVKHTHAHTNPEHTLFLQWCVQFNVERTHWGLQLFSQTYSAWHLSLYPCPPSLGKKKPNGGLFQLKMLKGGPDVPLGSSSLVEVKLNLLQVRPPGGPLQKQAPPPCCVLQKHSLRLVFFSHLLLPFCCHIWLAPFCRK